MGTINLSVDLTDNLAFSVNLTDREILPVNEKFCKNLHFLLIQQDVEKLPVKI